MQCNAMQCNAMQCSATQCSATQRNATQHCRIVNKYHRTTRPELHFLFLADILVVGATVSRQPTRQPMCRLCHATLYSHSNSIQLPPCVQSIQSFDTENRGTYVTTPVGTRVLKKKCVYPTNAVMDRNGSHLFYGMMLYIVTNSRCLLQLASNVASTS